MHWVLQALQALDTKFHVFFLQCITTDLNYDKNVEENPIIWQLRKAKWKMASLDYELILWISLSPERQKFPWKEEGNGQYSVAVQTYAKFGGKRNAIKNSFTKLIPTYYFLQKACLCGWWLFLWPSGRMWPETGACTNKSLKAEQQHPCNKLSVEAIQVRLVGSAVFVLYL